MSNGKKKGNKKQTLGEPWRGKSVEPLEWGGVKFYFPFAKYLPGLSDTIREQVRESIAARGVRHPIEVVIPPDSDVRIENERLVVGTPSEVLDVAADGAVEAVEVAPPVLLIHGEIRLRMAVSHHIPLEDIPVRAYNPVPEGVDAAFKDLLKNKGEQKRYDSLSSREKDRMRLIHDIWDTEASRRGGRCADGREKMIRLIDEVWEQGMGWKRLSNRKVGTLVGCSHREAGRSRRNMGANHANVSGTRDKLTELQDLKWTITGARDRMVCTVDEMDYNEWSLTDEKVGNCWEVTDAIIAYLDKQISALQDRINAAVQKGYDDLIAGGMGPVEAFFETVGTVTSLLDDDGDHSSDIDYDDLFGRSGTSATNSDDDGDDDDENRTDVRNSDEEEPPSSETESKPSEEDTDNDDPEDSDDEDKGPVMHLDCVPSGTGAGADWFTMEVVDHAIAELDDDEKEAA